VDKYDKNQSPATPTMAAELYAHLDTPRRHPLRKDPSRLPRLLANRSHADFVNTTYCPHFKTYRRPWLSIVAVQVWVNEMPDALSVTKPVSSWLDFLSISTPSTWIASRLAYSSLMFALTKAMSASLKPSGLRAHQSKPAAAPKTIIKTARVPEPSGAFFSGTVFRASGLGISG
jgi:hypothetical protein